MADAALRRLAALARRKMNRAVVAGAWLGPAGALWLGLGLLQLAGGDAPGLVVLAVGLSLLAAAPAAAVAALRGVVTGPAGIAAIIGLDAAAALAIWEFGLETRAAVELAIGTAGLAALWVALAPGVRVVPSLLTGLAVTLPAALLVGGVGGALAGLGLGAGVAAALAASPAAMAEPRLRGALLPALLGLVAALAVMAAPAVAWMRGEPAAVPVLATLVALPGLAVVAARRDAAALPLSTALLALGALSAGLTLAVASAPVAAGLVPAEAIGAWRFAVLGAGFLPVLAALLGAVLARGAVAAAMAPLLLLAVLSGGMPFLLGGTPWYGLEGLLAPLLATALAGWLAGRE
jgi:hypothetical protein